MEVGNLMITMHAYLCERCIPQFTPLLRGFPAEYHARIGCQTCQLCSVHHASVSRFRKNPGEAGSDNTMQQLQQGNKSLSRHAFKDWAITEGHRTQVLLQCASNN
jgi:hypothetical protein